MSDTFVCPITLEQFKEPIIIPTCGHTFDKNGLINLPNKKCPICKTDFVGNPLNFPFNWTIISHLGLEIKQNKLVENDIMSYDANQAKLDREKAINESRDMIVKNILHNIKILALKGMCTYEFDYKNISSVVVQAVMKELANRKFSVQLSSNNLYIGWNN
ncbi:SP-RING finger protein [Fadolivirus algeromassiliense]|jgi:hypothetical protein|uniref:SP-RING finger protein n=1 Tax=Fadolivirus FV1/VV64 TaxID=3070911 RepID=A0A7D3USE7_9VIRU|nr:SP-RING finger protein [Fadolivirus algeromassiliense]QKF93510.1 SP-RING finger protein [Fadolivirus FV1/VV64]